MKSKTDAVLTINAKGKVTLELPKIDPVPDNAMKLTAIAVMLKNEDLALYKLIQKQIDKFYKTILTKGK